MTPPDETQPILPQLLALLDQSDPAKAAQLRAELAGEDVAPQRPPTLLDVLRAEGFDAQELTVAEIPNGHEVPLVLGIALLELRDLAERVDALEDRDTAPTSTAPTPATEPVSEPVSVPDSEPAPADVLPAVETPPNATATQALTRAPVTTGNADTGNAAGEDEAARQ